MLEPRVNIYQDVEILTASKTRLVILLYEGAIRFINQAKLSIEKGDIQGKCDRISKAMAVIEELVASLNLKEGGKIAERLDTLYNYMMRKLALANLKSDPEQLNEVISILKVIHGAWIEVEKETVHPSA